MNYRYQRLGVSDLSALRALNQVFSEVFEDEAAYERLPPHDDYLKALLAKPSFIALVAMEDKNVVGGLVAYVLEKFEQERSEVYIYDLAVAEAHRRKGIATGLIIELKKIAKQIGAYAIYVQANPEDVPAVKLYESLGIKEEVFHFDIPIK